MENEKDKSSLIEEIANSVTHGIGLFLSIAGLVILVVLSKIHGDTWRIVSFSIYGSILIILYAASTLYHSFYFSSGRINYIFKIIDHSAIYLLIAGTYTPFTLVSLRGVWGWTFFGIIWGLALTGITLKMFFVKRFLILSTASYLVMGWLAVIAAYPVLKKIPLGGISWLVMGGILYTVGVIFHFFDNICFFL